MKLRVDMDKCVGHAQCFAVDPRLFPIDDAGYSALQDGPIADGDVPRAREGVAACPEMALVLED